MEKLSETKDKLDAILRHLLTEDYEAADKTYLELRASVQGLLSGVEIIPPSTLNDRRSEILEACARGHEFLIKRKGEIMAKLGPFTETEKGVTTISPRLFDSQRGQLIERTKKGESFLIKRRGRTLALLSPPPSLELG